MSTTGIESEWEHATAEVAARGLELKRTATPEQCRAIAGALELLAVERLQVRYRIEPLPRGRFRLSGSLDACVVQACVVTLDPVTTDIAATIDVEFRPLDQLPEPEADEQGALDAEEFEPIEGQRLPVGRIVLETLAAALPAFPRAEGAELDHREAGPKSSPESGPFASLAGWKPKDP